MEGNKPYITNLVNSIIGVSVLAMPFCLKQCGIALGLGLLFCAAWLTYLTCSMLASSAYQKRRRTYEYLALCTLGPTGKFAVELSMIGLMLGTCVAFYVVIGDLSYGTMARLIPTAEPLTLRMYTIIFTALCIALPLGNMKNLSVLSYFGFCSLIFYLAFLVVVIINSVNSGLLNWVWWDKVVFWRPAGIFQCLPIFSLAYACQCQLFIVYSSLEEPTVGRVEDIVFGAIKFVTLVYMSIGFFGYTTYREKIAGNLLLNFPSNILLDIIKMGFAMSVVLGFPLMISPCRQSIHTLVFAKPAGGGGMQPNTYIPPFLFKSITLGIVLLTMTIAILIPNVETILGLTGATMGSIICFIFPALIYEKAHAKGSGNIPKFVFVLGCVLLVVCTYSNLSNTSTATEPAVPDNPIVPAVPGAPKINPHNIDDNDVKVEPDDKTDIKKPEEDIKVKDKEVNNPKPIVEVDGPDHRHEPPNPVEPDNPPDKEDIAEPKIEEGEKEEKKEPVLQQEEAVQKQDYVNKDVDVNPPPLPEQDEKQNPVIEQKNDDKIVPNVQNGNNAPVHHPPLEGSKTDDQVEHAKQPILESNKKEEKKNTEEQQKGNVNPSNIGNNAPVPPAKPDDSNLRENRMSPKIIKPDENENPIHHENAGIANQPGYREGNVGKEQPSDSKKVIEKPVPSAIPKKEGDKGEESVAEKELLEKIKEQHDIQQQLLIEQQQLIKKLEEHQDKKEQAREENGNGDARIQEQGNQGHPSQQEQDIRKDPIKPLEHKEPVVNIENIPHQQDRQEPLKNNNLDKQGPNVPLQPNAAPSNLGLDNEPGGDKRIIEGGIAAPLNKDPKVMPGRELLSKDVDMKAPAMNVDQTGDAAQVGGDRQAQIQDQNRPKINTEVSLQQNAHGTQKDQPVNEDNRVKAPATGEDRTGNPIQVERSLQAPVQDQNRPKMNVGVPSQQGLQGMRKALPMDVQWLIAQQNLKNRNRNLGKDERLQDAGNIRKPRDVSYDIDENGDALESKAIAKDDVVDADQKISLVEEVNEKSEANEMETLDFNRKIEGDGEIDGKVEILNHGTELQGTLELDVGAQQEDGNLKEDSSEESMKNLETGQGRKNVGNGLENVGRVGDACSENDDECWQGKSKLRELKSLDENTEF